MASTRRHFFFGSLLAGAIPSAGFGSVPSLRTLGYKSPNEKLNIASIGAGLIWILVVVAVVVVAIYNKLVRRKNLAQEGWSGIDVQLKRRADLIPNLVDTVKGYAAHESGVFEKVTQARADATKAMNPEDRGRAETALSGALTNLMAVAENYPDLKASQNFQQLQASLADTEDQIQLARRYYNGAVRNLDISIQSFPGNVVAKLFHFQMMPYFQLDDPADKAVPKVALS